MQQAETEMAAVEREKARPIPLVCLGGVKVDGGFSRVRGWVVRRQCGKEEGLVRAGHLLAQDGGACAGGERLRAGWTVAPARVAAIGWSESELLGEQTARLCQAEGMFGNGKTVVMKMCVETGVPE